MNSHRFLIGAGLALAVVAMLTCAAPAAGLVPSAAGTSTSTNPPTVTATPTPTTAPTPATVMIGAVKGKTGDVRAGPGSAFPVLAMVKHDDKLNLTGRTSDSAWLQVCCYKNVPGWISASLVTPSGKVGSLPVPPSATPTVTAPLASGTPRAVARRIVNVRAGPGAGYPLLGSAKAGQGFDIVGKNQGGAWWQVCCIGAAKQKGWLAGSLVTVSGNTAAVQVARGIPTPAPKPTSRPTAAKPAPSPTQPASGESDPNMGCYLLQNQIGAELTVTITARDWQWNDTFKLAPMAERVYCLAPGRYTYTMDCPPPWADLNGQLTVEAGDRYLWPVRGEVH
jgi:uncharacterized protein YraI